jgi:hypothetical protein
LWLLVVVEVEEQRQIVEHLVVVVVQVDYDIPQDYP